MSHQDTLNQPISETEQIPCAERHPVAMENSPEETINRMRSLPERIAKLRELLNAFREASPS